MQVDVHSGVVLSCNSDEQGSSLALLHEYQVVVKTTVLTAEFLKCHHEDSSIYEFKKMIRLYLKRMEKTRSSTLLRKYA
jgi:hypothetical protein